MKAHVIEGEPVRKISAPNRHNCVANDPWTPEKGKYAEHPDAELVGTCLHECCERYKCPHCGQSWLEELPQ